MKAFASALLVSGAAAAASAIDFEQTGTTNGSLSFSLPYATRFVVGKESDGAAGAKVGEACISSWALSTDSAKLQFSLVMSMVLQLHDALSQADGIVSQFMCWKNG